MEAPTFRNSEEAYNASAIARRLALMDASECIAEQSESSPYDRVRDALRQRYRNLIGVNPDLRHKFRQELKGLHNVTVDELVRMYDRE